jgi:hypothetical protein
MSFDFRLRVSGLCAFVPLADGSMRIVLVNARDFDHSGKEVTATTPNSDIHIPVLAVPEQFTTAKGRRPTFRFKNKELLSTPTTFLAFLLADDDLEVTPVIPSAVVPPADVGACATDAVPLGAFGWIARMRDVGASTMKAALKSGTLPNTNDVLARLRFANGECRTTTYALDRYTSPGRLIKWTYTDGVRELPNYTHRPLSELITARIAIDDRISKEVIIYSVKNDPIVIVPTLAEPSPFAYLLNIPMADLLNESLPSAATGRDHHFMHFYRLADNSTPTYVPQPLPYDDCGTIDAGLGGPKCPPSAFDS